MQLQEIAEQNKNYQIPSEREGKGGEQGEIRVENAEFVPSGRNRQKANKRLWAAELASRQSKSM